MLFFYLFCCCCCCCCFLLGGYPLRVFLCRLSLRSNLPKLSFFQLIFPFFRLIDLPIFRFDPTALARQVGTRVRSIIHVIFRFVRCWPRLELVVLQFTCDLTILFSEVARCWPRFVLPLQRVVVFVVFCWPRLQLVVPGK